MIRFLQYSVSIVFGSCMGGIAYINTNSIADGLLASCICTLVAAAVMHVATWEHKPDGL